MVNLRTRLLMFADGLFRQSRCARGPCVSDIVSDIAVPLRYASDHIDRFFDQRSLVHFLTTVGVMSLVSSEVFPRLPCAETGLSASLS